MAEREFQLIFTGHIDPDVIPEIQEGAIEPRESEYVYRILGFFARGGWETARFEYIEPPSPSQTAEASPPMEEQQTTWYDRRFVALYPAGGPGRAERPGEEVAVIDIGSMQDFSRITEKSAELASSIFNDLYATISPWIKRLRDEDFVPHRVEQYLHIIDRPNSPEQLLIVGFKAGLIHDLIRELDQGTITIKNFGKVKLAYLRRLAAAAVRLPEG